MISKRGKERHGHLAMVQRLPLSQGASSSNSVVVILVGSIALGELVTLIRGSAKVRLPPPLKAPYQRRTHLWVDPILQQSSVVRCFHLLLYSAPRFVEHCFSLSG